MNLPPFKLERYFARYEFKVKHLLSSSDCQALRLDELLALADDEHRAWWNDLALGYTESAGHPRLRAAIASLHERTSPDDVLVAVPEEAIFIAMSTLVEPGDHVVALSPCYQSLAEVARARGCPVTAWTLRLESGGWRLDLNALAHAITPRTRMLVLNFPHNPTGFQPARAELDAILGLARQHDLIVFSDEMYRLLEHDPADRLPPVSEMYEKGVSLSGLSKSFALPGLRVGWLMTQNPRWIERWLAFKDYLTICNSATSEVLATIALRAHATLIRRNLDLIAENLARADAFFAARQSQFVWPRPRAGSVAFPRWTGALPFDQLSERALDRGVMMVPGHLFDFPGDHFRVGLGRQNFQGALDELGHAIDQSDF